MSDLPPVEYDQGMGATDASGLVVAFPFAGGAANRYWIDTLAGDDRNNGLSLYPGHLMNPDGTRGAAATGIPGAKATTSVTFLSLPADGACFYLFQALWYFVAVQPPPGGLHHGACTVIQSDIASTVAQFAHDLNRSGNGTIARLIFSSLGSQLMATYYSYGVEGNSYFISGTINGGTCHVTPTGVVRLAGGVDSKRPGPVINISQIMTYAKRSNKSDQIFIPEGQNPVIRQLCDWYGYGGRSAAFPFCIQSCDPADPYNTAKHGRAGTAGRGARPIMTLDLSSGAPAFPGNPSSGTADNGGVVIRGIEFRASGSAPAVGFGWNNSNILLENNVFNGVSFALVNGNVSTVPVTKGHINFNNIARRNVSYNQYSTVSHSQGMYGHASAITLEDNIFWHCGWKNTGNYYVDRAAAGADGGPTIYNHCVYVGGEPTNTVILVARRNVLIDGSASGLSLRGSHLAHHNVIIDCPTPDFNGGGSGSDAESPNGVSQQAYCHLVLGGADIGPNQPRMQGFASSDGTPDSFYAYCLYANSPGYGKTNNNWLHVQNSIPAQISHMAFYHNRAYAFAPPAQKLVLSTSLVGSPTSIHITADADNIVSPTSPMTNAQLYAAVGFSSKPALIAAMIADPSEDWAYKLLAAAAVGFNFSFNYDTP